VEGALALTVAVVVVITVVGVTVLSVPLLFLLLGVLVLEGSQGEGEEVFVLVSEGVGVEGALAVVVTAVGLTVVALTPEGGRRLWSMGSIGPPRGGSQGEGEQVFVLVSEGAGVEGALAVNVAVAVVVTVVGLTEVVSTPEGGRLWPVGSIEGSILDRST